MSLAHIIFSNKVLSVLESLVHRTPYVQLISHPTWHSRISSWTLSMKIPESILHAARQSQTPAIGNMKVVRYQFWTKVVVTDDSISVQGEGAPNVLSLFKGKAEGVSSINGYDCDLVDLPIILLQQLLARLSNGCMRKPSPLASKQTEISYHWRSSWSRVKLLDWWRMWTLKIPKDASLGG